MKNEKTKGEYRSGIVKALIFYGVFLILYGVYKALPEFPLSIICATNESNFQHYKAAFFSSILAVIIEFLIYRKRIEDKKVFLYARLTSTIFVPWLIFLIWYIAPAVYGQLPTVLEIVYANIATLLVALGVVVFERSWETIEYSRLIKVVLWILFAVSIGLYMRFTFGALPWADVFVEPNWK